MQDQNGDWGHLYLSLRFRWDLGDWAFTRGLNR